MGQNTETEPRIEPGQVWAGKSDPERRVRVKSVNPVLYRNDDVQYAVVTGGKRGTRPGRNGVCNVVEFRIRYRLDSVSSPGQPAQTGDPS